MSEGNLNTLINGVTAVVVAFLGFLGIVFARMPKNAKPKTEDEGEAKPTVELPKPPPGTDPALVAWVRETNEKLIAEAFSQRDAAIKRAEAAEAENIVLETANQALTSENVMLKQKITNLEQRVADLEAALGRSPDSKTRHDDWGGA